MKYTKEPRSLTNQNTIRNKIKNTIYIEPLELPPPIISSIYYQKEVVINICKKIKKKKSEVLFNEAFLNKLLNKCVQIK